MQVIPYLDFNGRAAEAIEFYTQTLGAEKLLAMRFDENPEGRVSSPETAGKIMHATLKIGSTLVMMSDGRCDQQRTTSFTGISLSISCDTIADAERIFHALIDGGNILVPLQATFFSPTFGYLADKFGVNWMVVVNQDSK